jgi:uncharacterized protein YaiI (UPF0178 family)
VRIWVDADACPRPIKEILYRAADRVPIQVTLVANKALRPPPSRYVTVLHVEQGADVADQRIVDEVEKEDLVVTTDIPLAAAVVAKGAVALDPRGTLYTEENVRERLAMRDLLQELRSEGMTLGGPPPLSKNARQEFANQLDRWLARRG